MTAVSRNDVQNSVSKVKSDIGYLLNAFEIALFSVTVNNNSLVLTNCVF
jgi:hypothetical protein